MMPAKRVLETLEQALRSIDMLYRMPHLPEQERETRIKAIRANAEKVFAIWAEERDREQCHAGADSVVVQ